MCSLFEWRIIMELLDVRADIDRTDTAMKELFIRRMELAAKVADIKAAGNDNVYKPEREKDMIERLSAGIAKDIRDEYISFIETLVRLSRKYQYGIIYGNKDDNAVSGRVLCIRTTANDMINICRIAGDYDAKVSDVDSNDSEEILIRVSVNDENKAASLMIQLQNETQAEITYE